MIKFYNESLDEFYSDAEPLLQKYWKEADERRESNELKPKFDIYCSMEMLGLIKIYTARDEGNLVGFVVFVLQDCHQTQDLKAITEVSYLDPEYRGKSIMEEMHKAAEEDLKHNNVTKIFWTLKTEFPHDTLMSKLGLKHVENVYMKEVV